MNSRKIILWSRTLSWVNLASCFLRQWILEMRRILRLSIRILRLSCLVPLHRFTKKSGWAKSIPPNKKHFVFTNPRVHLWGLLGVHPFNMILSHWTGSYKKHALLRIQWHTRNTPIICIISVLIREKRCKWPIPNRYYSPAITRRIIQ